jgi:hypothetical protein
MMNSYQILKKWFLENYEHLGFKLSGLYQDEENLNFYFRILHNNNKTVIHRINLEKVMDFTSGDSELRKILFDALLRQNGYRVDGDFTPLKQIKEFNL